jgi:hypothetical protein
VDIIINKLNRIKRDLRPSKIWLRVFSKKRVQKYVIEELLQREQLFEKGIDETGSPITNADNGRTTYSRLTEILSGGRKKEGEHYTLFDSGEFYKSMVFLLGNNYFQIDADPIKQNDNLFSKFGEGIIGLTEQSKEKLRVRLKFEYQIELKRLLLNN